MHRNSALLERNPCKNNCEQECCSFYPISGSSLNLNKIKWESKENESQKIKTVQSINANFRYFKFKNLDLIRSREAREKQLNYYTSWAEMGCFL